MNKLFKKLAVLVSARTLLLAVGVFAACGGSGKTTYTVTVLKPDGSSPAAGIMISYCTADDSRCSDPKQLDENGQFTFEDETTDYVIKILSSPSDVACVVYNENHQAHAFEKGKNTITIVLTEKQS